MKIGIDIRNIGKKRTGDEAVFFNLVKNLARIDNINEYLLFTDITDTTILRNIVVKPLGITDRNNLEIVSLKCLNKFIWNAWTLPKYLRKNPVDVYHTQYILPFFISRKIKLITTIHDISFNFYPQFIKRADLFFLKLLIPASLKRADKIIAVSEFTKKEIVDFYKIAPDKVKVTYNSIGENFSTQKARYSPRFGPPRLGEAGEAGECAHTNGDLEKVRKKYNLPEKFILYIGTMQPRKNLPFLISAYAKIKNKLNGIKLVIAGRKSHNCDKKIDEVVAEHKLKDEVLFPGYIDETDKPILFNLSHFFAFPSLYEGFGIPVLEAMSQGVPVLAADIPSLKEVGGEAILYFNPRDLASLEKALYNISINQNLREKLTKSGLERSQFFSWEETARKILEIYKSSTEGG